jgi:hypothetical protein
MSESFKTISITKVDPIDVEKTVGVIQQIINTDFKTAEDFTVYHLQNPDVWRYFQDLADEMRRKRDTYGAKAIMETVRYYYHLNKDARAEFKINNNYTAYYARMYNHKRKCRFFNVRAVKGLKNAE